MSDRHAIAKEVLGLISEQMEALKGGLSGTEASRYIERKRRIEDLLSLLDGAAGKGQRD